MKRALFAFCLLCSLTASAQTTEEKVSKLCFSVDIEAGPCVEKKLDCKAAIGASAILDYQFTHIFSAGLGMNINQHLTKKSENMFFIPIFADAKVNFTRSKVSPFLDMRVGCSFIRSTSLYLSPALGVEYKLNEKSHLQCALSYTMQAPDGKDSFPSRGYSCNNLTIRFGYGF